MTKEKFLQKVNKESVVTMDGSDLSDDIVRLVNTVASLAYDAGRASAFEWHLASEDTPHDAPYLCQVTERQECGNVWTFMAVRHTNMNQWLLKGNEKLVVWTHLPPLYKPEEKQDGKL